MGFASNYQEGISARGSNVMLFAFGELLLHQLITIHLGACPPLHKAACKKNAFLSQEDL